MRRVLIGVIASTMLLAVGQARGDSIAFYNEANHVRGGVDKLFNSLTNPTAFDDDDGTSIYDAWCNALNGADILVLPSLNDIGSHTIDATLGATRQLVENFVFNGGGLIALGSPMFGSEPYRPVGFSGNGSYSTWFLNQVFNGEGSSDAFDLSPNRFIVGGTTNRNPSIGAPFSDDPSPLPNSDGTSLLNEKRLPSGALSVYHEMEETSVFGVEYGSGRIAFLGYDWSDKEPAETAIWKKVLDSAVEYVRPEEVNVVPEPTTLALWQLGAAGVVLAIRRRRRK